MERPAAREAQVLSSPIRPLHAEQNLVALARRAPIDVHGEQVGIVPLEIVESLQRRHGTNPGLESGTSRLEPPLAVEKMPARDGVAEAGPERATGHEPCGMARNATKASTTTSCLW
jgi:hypothetical protein